MTPPTRPGRPHAPRTSNARLPSPGRLRQGSRPSQGSRAPGTRRGRVRDEGSVVVVTLFLVLAGFVFAGLVLDGALALATKNEAISVAQSAARDGARQLDVRGLRVNGVLQLDQAQAKTSAENWVRRAGMTGTVTVDADTVSVSVQTSQPTQLLQLVGLRSLPITAQATAIAVQP